MEGKNKSEIHITNNFNAPIGQHIDHVDTINFSMDKEGRFHFENVGQVNGVPSGNGSSPAPVAEGDGEALVARLMPIFYNKEDDVRQFLTEIRGMADKDITDLVNRWVKEKRISDYGNSRKGDLWEVLNDARIYKSSRQNWCRRVY